MLETVFIGKAMSETLLQYQTFVVLDVWFNSSLSSVMYWTVITLAAD